MDGAQFWNRHVLLPDAAATVQLGEALGARLGPGQIVFLIGDLGAGKTTLARGIITAWCGAVQETPSPTYTLAQSYEGLNGVLTHMDLYRLRHPEEVFELGLEDAMQEGVVLIEWPERLGVFAPKRRVEISLSWQNGGRLARLAAVPAEGVLA